MRSLLKVMKPNHILSSEDIVLIPDIKTASELTAQLNNTENDTEEQQLIRAEIIEKAVQEGRQMAEQIRDQAEQEREELLSQARLMSDGVLEQARQKGYTEGAKKREVEIDACLNEVRLYLGSMAKEQAQFMEEHSQKLKYLAVEIAGKVIQAKIQEDEIVLQELVKKALSTVKDAEWVSVEISHKLPKLIEYLKKDLARQEKDYGTKRIEVSETELPSGGCRIQTPDGVIDASVSTQLENLLNFFRQMDNPDN